MKNPQEITEALYKKSLSFIEKPIKELTIGGILAGIFVSLASITSATVCSDMKNYFGVGFTKLISGIVFTLGLILIVLSGSDLFTGSNLNITSILKNRKNFRIVIRNWALIYITNFIGSIIMVFLIYNSGILNDQSISKYVINVTESKLNLSVSEALIRGILCNFLVCLAVRLGEASEDIPGKIMGFVYAIGAFVINGFEHSVANMFYIPLGILAGAKNGIYLSWQSFFTSNLIPVTIGNIIGGGLFVGVVYYIMHCKYFKEDTKQGTLKIIKGDKYENIKN